MHTFRTLDRQIGFVPAAMARTLGTIDTARGREQAFKQQRPQVLDALVDVARIQSTEASNAIEGVAAPRKRIEALVADKTKPRNRPEAEIAGYRAVLDTIHSSAAHIPFTPSVVEQLHRDLYQYTSVPAGRWKSSGNAITEDLPDGTTRERFRTVPAAETSAAMEELHERFLAARDAGEHHPLLLIGCYVFDFLAIHPFLDGNGRMARLLTLLLLYQSGYDVVFELALGHPHEAFSEPLADRLDERLPTRPFVLHGARPLSRASVFSHASSVASASATRQDAPVTSSRRDCRSSSSPKRANSAIPRSR